MYKLLIVDDEEIEREGMAEFIPWTEYGIELVGTAWNGVEGFQQIQEKMPDIVLTDIKMPVMNGIELIKRVKVDYPDIEFVVLSGYGEYEFTSQAMEEGVRHYVLKPFDEEKIMAVLDKVKAEVQMRRQKEKLKQEYHHTVRKLLPWAKEQIFRNMILDREQPKEDYKLFLEEVGNEQIEVELLAFRRDKGYNYLEQFIISNILGELLGKGRILLSANLENDMIFLTYAIETKDMEPVVKKARLEFSKFDTDKMQVALSKTGNLSDVGRLYVETQQLLRMGNVVQQGEFSHYNYLLDEQNNAFRLVDYGKLKEAKEYGEILFEIYLTFMKMDLHQYTFLQKKEICDWILKILYGEARLSNKAKEEKIVSDWNLLVQLVDQISNLQGISHDQSKDKQRIRDIQLAVYENIHNPELNIQFLAREILFMNEDYFGRIFSKNWNEKFSTYLQQQRIALAQRILLYNPEVKVTHLAQQVGYLPDAQYFSKAFRKITGMSPSEYKDFISVQDKTPTSISGE